MLDLRAFRFDGLHLEPSDGTFVTPTGSVQRTDRRTISFGPPSDLTTPIGAILHLDVLLEQGESIGVMGIEKAYVKQAYFQFRHTYVIAPGVAMYVTVNRRGGRITTILCCENGKLTIERQDKPAGC
ncbi:MAG: hypothetical protein Q8R16_02000 [bacterium]|nr:hypothetical protein [bacterium]